MGKKKTCRRCFLSEDFPDADINTDGLCVFCAAFKENKIIVQSRKKKEFDELKLIAGKIKAYAKAFKLDYDCIIGASGGLDSTYVSYVARKLLDLNPLVVKYDNGFCHEMADENLRKACEILNVDLKIIPPLKDDTAYISHSIKATRPLGVYFTMCFSCHYIIHSLVYKMAKDNNIKHVLVSSNVLERKLDNVPKKVKIAAFKNNFKKISIANKFRVIFHLLLARYHLVKLKLKTDGLSRRFFKNVRSNYAPILPKELEFVNVSNYLEWDLPVIEDTIRRELSWVAPRKMKLPYMRFDCYLVALIDISFKKLLGITKRGLLHNWLVQTGLKTKEDFKEDFEYLEDESRLQNDVDRVFKKLAIK